MKPYYEDSKSGIVIYHGTVEDVIPMLPPSDLLLADPPFGVGNFVQVTGNVRGQEVEWNESPPSSTFLNFLQSRATHRIIWGANYFNCFEGRGALVWIKNQPMPDFSKAEIASVSWGNKVEIINLTWTNFVNTKETDHPCERPVGLYVWCIGLCPVRPKTILAPYSGSGSVLVAAKDLGISATGIEQDERWCEASARRLQQEVLQLA